jgi:hypothetical protein
VHSCRRTLDESINYLAILVHSRVTKPVTRSNANGDTISDDEIVGCACLDGIVGLLVHYNNSSGT